MTTPKNMEVAWRKAQLEKIRLASKETIVDRYAQFITKEFEGKNREQMSLEFAALIPVVIGGAMGVPQLTKEEVLTIVNAAIETVETFKKECAERGIDISTLGTDG